MRDDGNEPDMVIDSNRTPPSPTRRGRPRRLRLGQVVEAALAVGVHQMTMAAVAERLGVGKAVLYSYVSSREELVQLATAHAAQRHRFPDDTGQPWARWVLEYARALFEVMTMRGGLLESWLSGSHSPVVELDAAEMWVRVLTRHGFTGEAALQMRRAVSHLVIGAAAGMKHERALRDMGHPRPDATRQAMDSRPPEEALLLRDFTEVFARELTENSWEYALYLLLKGASVSREALALDEGHSCDAFGLLPMPD